MSKERRRAKHFQEQRRRLVKVALYGGAVLVTAGLGGVIYLAESKPKGEQAIDEAVIWKEVKRLKITPDSEETQLWSEAYQVNNIKQEFNKETAGIASSRLLDSLKRMTRSKNPYFQEASNYLINLMNQKKLRLQIVKNLGDRKHDGLVTGYGVVDDKVSYAMRASGEFILNNSSALTLAGLITHEAQHIKRLEEITGQLPADTPGSSVVQKLEEYNLVKQNIIYEEALAYGKGSQSYIYEVGLTNKIYDPYLTGQDNMAANFIRNGSNAQSTSWIRFIQNQSEITDNIK